MSLHLHWYLPTNGDGRGIVGSGRAGASGIGDKHLVERAPTIDYLGQIARSVEQLGFEAVLTPTGSWCEDAWLTTAALSQVTKRLKFLVAFRPGFISPTLAAQQAQTFQRLTGGRLLLNVVTGGDPTEQRRFGDFLDHDERYARTAEFLQVLRGASSGTPFDFAGEHLRVEGATAALSDWGLPPLFFGGASPAAEDVAAQHIEVYLAWGETPPQITERLERMREKAAAAGRQLTFGIRLHVLGRDTAQQAWGEAHRMLDELDPARIAEVQEQLARMDSVGQRRMQSLHGGGRDGLEIYPNLWAGYGLVRGGAGTALVGSHEEIAERLEEYHALGIEHAILSGQPHLEEAYWFGEGAGRLLRQRGVVTEVAESVGSGAA
ncbi:LLM class flavin-dependent oxidoreductase [uncultured Jatrophihabitans sp.]|uniref:LLM class flavin-dependent oxidoreductase n=1 Tax=uncultured Jatrophihabitans sp. TaxID=1610747 RepID=UPI0035CADB65